jgi:hypothetical protein
MSKTLRRPMFRGGSVNSRGTGITSGLDDSGYADGGRVGFQRGGGYLSPSYTDFYSPTSQFYERMGYSPVNSSVYNPVSSMIQQREQRIKEMESRDDPFLNLFTPTSSQRLQRENELNRPRTPQQYDEAIQRGLDITRSKPFGRSDESFPERKPINVIEEEINTGTGAGADLVNAEEDELVKQAKLYEKLLGGEEARSQSIYDAMLAASPAFFKGKNLREAVPQVFESINKSGAFDKPRDIKQAASQLAIQRRILIDKSKAEAAAKMAELGIKKPGTLTERYSANIKSGINEIKAAELAVMDSYGDKYKPFAFNPATAKKGEVYKIPKDPKKPNAGYFFAEIIDPKAGTFNPLPF